MQLRFYNKYHDSFKEQIGVFNTYKEAEAFIKNSQFDLDENSEYVEITELET